MNELVVRKATKKNWKTRCGSFLLAILATCYAGNALAEVQLTPRPGLGVYTDFNLTPDTVNGPIMGNSMANGRPNGDSFFWDGDSTGRNLNALEESGITVNIVTRRPDVPDPIYGTTTITLNSNLAFTAPGGGDVYFLSNLTWSGAGASFSVEGGSSGQVHVGGGATLDLANHLSVNEGATLVIDIYGGGTSTAGGIIVSTGSNNTGTIDLQGTVLTLNGDLGGSGTINLNPYAMLIVNHGTTSQNIRGAHSHGASSTRGQISVSNSTEFHGHLINDISFTGGGNAYIFSDNTTELNTLHVHDGTNVILEGPANLGNAAAYLYNNGGISKDYRSSTDNGALTIANNIHIEGSGMLNSIITLSEIGWQGDADQLADYDMRFVINGEVSGGSILNINDTFTAAGTVVLTHDNRNYGGNFQIHRGVLEISNQTNLGNNTNFIQNTVYIGDTISPLERSVFRVVGNAENKLNPEIIEHWINLETQHSFYEVFTNAVDQTKSDCDRFIVLQTGQINGSGTLNKSGDGILELGNFNSYSGDTIIWHGVLRISDANQINNTQSSKLYIGGDTLMEEHNFRPVFETKHTDLSTGSIVIDTGVVINLTNSTVRTTGINNETIFT
ncbi:MAG: hypothetical protein LBE12_14840, partial [Planctomycetaceae bacterium]|nr:hypothetical protein [Planctomycetaceae bacterium]